MAQVVEGRPDFMNLMFIEMVEFKSAHARQLFTYLFPQGMQLQQQLVGILSRADTFHTLPDGGANILRFVLRILPH